MVHGLFQKISTFILMQRMALQTMLLTGYLETRKTISGWVRMVLEYLNLTAVTMLVMMNHRD